MIVSKTTSHNATRLSCGLGALAVASIAFSPAAFAEVTDPFVAAREKACGVEPQVTPSNSAELEKYAKCFGKFFEDNAAKAQADYEARLKDGRADAPPLEADPKQPCALAKLNDIDGDATAAKFLQGLYEKRLDESHALLASDFRAKVKVADVASLINVYFPNLKGGFSGGSGQEFGSSLRNQLCSGKVPVSHIVVHAGLKGVPQKLIAFEVVEENGEGRIRDIYAKTRSDVASLDGIKPFESFAVVDAIARFAQSVEANDAGSFLQAVSAEKRFVYEPDISAGNSLTAAFAPYKGKIKSSGIRTLDAEPDYSLKPAAPRMENGYPVVDVEGTMDTKPSVTAFKMKFVYDLGHWVVHEFKFDLKP